MDLIAILFALWLWFSGALLNSVVPLSMRMKRTFFHVSVIYLPLYLPVFGIFFYAQTVTQNASLVLISLAIIFPLHLFAMFCQIYSWYFVSKSLAMAEKQRLVSLGDYLGYFCSLWIFPIGVWIIPPSINRLYAATLSHQPA